VAIFGVALVACGGTAHETDQGAAGAAGAAGATPGSCAEDEVFADGVCEHVGLPLDMLCAPGEMGVEGVCEPAGVPTDSCGIGFVHDGDGGCEPVLPAEPCPAGTMAVPGDTACRQVAPCAPGTWGDIPVDSTTEHVDPAYSGMISDGSAQQPWTTIADGIAAAAPLAIVALAAGSYAEDVLIQKPVLLWGVCPALVEITGIGTGAAVLVREGANGTELRALSISGSGSGLFVSGSQDVLAAQLWVHDNPNRGVLVQDDYGYTGLWLVDSLVELNGEAGVYVYGSSVRIEESVVRDSLPDGGGLFGSGISAYADTSVMLLTSVLEGNHSAGIVGASANISIDSTVVRDTLPDAMGGYGWGVALQDGNLDLMSSLVQNNRGAGVNVHGVAAFVAGTVVRGTAADDRGLAGWGLGAHVDPATGVGGLLWVLRSLVEDNRELGLFAGGSRLEVQGVLVRRTQPNATGYFGRGIDVEPSPNAMAPVPLAVRDSVIEDNHEVGVFVSGGEGWIEGTVVRGTQLDPVGDAGRGIATQPHPGIPTTLEVYTSLVEQNHGIGVSVAGADVVLRELEIRDTLPQGDGHFGRGVNVQPDQLMRVPASLVLRSALIEGNHEAGVGVISAAAQIEKSIVRDTRASSDGRFGDGVLVFSKDAPADATITQSRIEASARAAVSGFGAHVQLAQSRLVCQAFDLAGEPWNQVQSVFDDLGENWCGCPVEQHACKLVSAGLEAPQAIGD
jgi:hypothetical protein